jgi:cytochrome c-type biogenesis protein CcmE
LKKGLQKKWQNRLVGLVVTATLVTIGVMLILKVFNDNVVFYFTPTELLQKDVTILKAPYRIGGLVKKNSLHINADLIDFTVTDLNSDIKVRYKGIIPSLFKEEQGTVALGHMDENGLFIATELLAKHDENYMPKEVADTLKKSGEWQGE